MIFSAFYFFSPCIFRYFDKTAGKCKNFAFGGCEGNGNRFSSQEECESVCFLLEEPELSGTDTEDSKVAICKLEMDEGPCDDTLKRWHYDHKRGTCVPFVYGGCAGNRYVLYAKFCKILEYPSHPRTYPNINTRNV